MIKSKESFLNYIFGGCEISLQIAIDFTGSNGAVTDPNSLHYWDLNSNEYIKAINAVGNILQNYDTDKKFPTYGFGGRIPWFAT